MARSVRHVSIASKGGRKDESIRVGCHKPEIVFDLPANNDAKSRRQHNNVASASKVLFSYDTTTGTKLECVASAKTSLKRGRLRGTSGIQSRRQLPEWRVAGVGVFPSSGSQS